MSFEARTVNCARSSACGERRPGQELEAAGHFDQLDGVLAEVVHLPQLLERGPHVGERRVGIEHAELFHRQRAGGREERGFNQLRERRHGESP